MKLAFCGTPAFAVPTLKLALRAGYEIPLVLTQPGAKFEMARLKPEAGLPTS